MDITRKIISRIKLRQLKLLVAIDDLKTLKAASDSLGVSQPAATQALKELEDALGCELFTRGNRGVQPTRFGQVLIRHARSILAMIRHAGEELSDLESGAGGRVIVGTLLASSALVLPKAIMRLRESRPNVVVKVIEGTNDILIPKLLNGDIDMVVGRLPENDYRKGTEQVHLYEEDIIIFTSPSHRLANRGYLTLKDLVDDEWVLPPIETTLRSQLEKLFFDAGLTPPICAIESTSWLANLHLWRNANFIGVAPEHTIREILTRGEVVKLPVAQNAKLGPVGLTLKKDYDLAPVAHYFIESLRAVCEEL